MLRGRDHQETGEAFVTFASERRWTHVDRRFGVIAHRGPPIDRAGPTLISRSRCARACPRFARRE